MPLKINVGGSKKVGEPNYGSRGASINLEMELDATLVSDPAKLQDRIRQLFGLVRTSLAEELHNGNGSATHPNGNGNGNGHATNQPSARSREPATRGNGHQPRPATASQVKAIHAIAKNRGIDLSAILRERFQVRRPDDLSIGEASRLIDELKSNDNGEGG